MPSWRPISETIHLTALGVWLGALVMTGASPAVIFPTAKDLHPSLPVYAGYHGEHWRILGGQVASRIFIIGDVVQFTCAMLALISAFVLIIVAKVPFRRPAVLVRLAFLALAAAILGAHLFFLAPRMNGHMLAFWDAARRGDNPAADLHRAAFDRLHPVATNLLAATALAVLLALVFAAWSAATPERNTRHAPAALRGPNRPRTLEEPRLLRTPR